MTTDRLLPATDSATCAWHGDVTWRETSRLREALFDLLDTPGLTTVSVDVRTVLSIDNIGIAMLIGADRRASASGKRLVLVDSNGPVTAKLARTHLAGRLAVTQVIEH
jgi:anti-anti-sigma regulatory factor